MYCPKCGTQNADNATQCVKCGEVLQPAAAAPPPSSPQPNPPFSQQPVQHVPNYLVFAILVTIFCCLPFGIVSIIYAAQVNGKLAAGDYQGARDSSNKAKMWCWIAFGVGIVVAIGYGLVMVLGAMATHR